MDLGPPHGPSPALSFWAEPVAALGTGLSVGPMSFISPDRIRPS